MLKLIFAGAVLGSGAIATVASGDLSVGAGTALATAFGMVAGGAVGAGLIYGVESLFGKTEGTLQRMANCGVGGLLLGAIAGGVLGFNSLEKPTEEVVKITSAYTTNLSTHTEGLRRPKP